MSFALIWGHSTLYPCRLSGEAMLRPYIKKGGAETRPYRLI